MNEHELSVWNAINDLLHYTQSTAKNTNEQSGVRAFAAIFSDRLRVIQKLVSPPNGNGNGATETPVKESPSKPT